MYKVVIADSSCLIALSKIGELEILHDLFENIFIPKVVYVEVVVQGTRRPGSEELK